MQYVNIPEERVPVLIGEGGGTKKEIEERTKTKLTIQDTEVSIEGADSYSEWVTMDVVKAIGRGFSPEKALQLLKEDTVFELIQLTDLVKDSEKTLIRYRGRIIGEGGKTRRYIEEITGSFVSVYGKTVSIIGSYEGVAAAKEAVVRIASGSPHKSVYKYLERWRGGAHNL